MHSVSSILKTKPVTLNLLALISSIKNLKRVKEKLHEIPGMPVIIQSLATNFAYKDIVHFHLSNKDSSDSPSTLRKILGHESKTIEKFLGSGANQMLLNATIKTQQNQSRKSDLNLTKYELATVDMFVKELNHLQFGSYLNEIIFKLSEICEKDLHIVRAIYKYILVTQLDNLRRNQTGSLVMRNYDNGIESVNTIFSRLCRLFFFFFTE